MLCLTLDRENNAAEIITPDGEVIEVYFIKKISSKSVRLGFRANKEKYRIRRFVPSERGFDPKLAGAFKK